MSQVANHTNPMSLASTNGFIFPATSIYANSNYPYGICKVRDRVWDRMLVAQSPKSTRPRSWGWYIPSKYNSSTLSVPILTTATLLANVSYM